MAELKRRSRNILIAVDQLFYVLLTLGHGDPDETLSAAAYRLERDGKLAGRIFRPLIDMIFFFDDNHCYRAWMAERR